MYRIPPNDPPTRLDGAGLQCAFLGKRRQAVAGAWGSGKAADHVESSRDPLSRFARYCLRLLRVVPYLPDQAGLLPLIALQKRMHELLGGHESVKTVCRELDGLAEYPWSIRVRLRKRSWLELGI